MFILETWQPFWYILSFPSVPTSPVPVQPLSRVLLFATPWIAARQASLSITNSQSLLKLMYESVMPSSHLILCRPLLLLSPIPPIIRVFSKESTLRMRWPKYWSFSFSISPFNEHPGLISFKMDWLDLLAVQGTLKLLSHVLFVACYIENFSLISGDHTKKLSFSNIFKYYFLIVHMTCQHLVEFTFLLLCFLKNYKAKYTFNWSKHLLFFITLIIYF